MITYPSRPAWRATRADHHDRLLARSMAGLRLSLALIFLVFGALKLVPGVSPAADIATRTMLALTFDLVPAGIGALLVGVLEVTIGVCLLTRRGARLGLLLLGIALVGILSPLVLFPGELFAGPFLAPTLLGQYVIKDIVLAAAASVLAVWTLTRPPRPRAAPSSLPRPARCATPGLAPR